MVKFILNVILLGVLSYAQPNANKFVVKNDKILSEQVVQKIEQIGTELFGKSGIFVGICAYENLDGKNLKQSFNELNINPPYAVLMITKKEHKVDIFADDDTLRLFDKEQILSPFPERGTILPILTSKNGKDIYNAAILNGYADLSEQIATKLNLTLENGIGNANKNTLNLIRFFVYGSILFVILLIFYRKFMAKYAK
ncbi:hypothetical protein [Campylobacter anatolicus]|uniref:hypothetical protein n=1 Tax=Campylobacter anatolicus TaxID=2829105 RepID=UPI001E632F16|nr:hypothetical protein [Campylobacter anatolicus]